MSEVSNRGREFTADEQCMWDRAMVRFKANPPPPTEGEKRAAIAVLRQWSGFLTTWWEWPWMLSREEDNSLLIVFEAERTFGEGAA